MLPEGSDLIFDHRHNAADRVFLECRGTDILVCRAFRTGPSPLAAKLVAGHGAGGRKPRPGCRMQPGLEEEPPGPGTDASLGSSGGAGSWNVAVEQSWAIPIAGMQEDAAARHVRLPVPPSR
jgi:hypothetical protein